MDRIMIAAHKGGAGKTGVAVNLAAALASQGHSVLVIDVDPQGMAGAALGVEHPEKPTLYEALMGQATIREAVSATGTPGLALIPSNLDLAGAEVELPRMSDSWPSTLNRALKSLNGFCDVAIIDTPPGLGVLSATALRASTAAFAVCPLDYAAYRSLFYLKESVERAKVPLLGIIPTFVGFATRHAKEVSAELVRNYGELLLPGIPQRVAIKDAALAGEPVLTYQPGSDAVQSFDGLAKEVLRRVQGTNA